jgi:hypothetical protein
VDQDLQLHIKQEAHNDHFFSSGSRLIHICKVVSILGYFLRIYTTMSLCYIFMDVRTMKGNNLNFGRLVV